MMGANPGNVVRTRPVLVTDANARLSLRHVTVAFAITWPAESRATAASCALSPATTVSWAGLTVRVATGTGGGNTTSVSWHASITVASTSAREARRMRVQYTSGLGTLGAMASVTLRDLAKRFDPSHPPALRDFSLYLNHADFLALLGAS